MNNSHSITLPTLVFMILSTAFGFFNVSTAYSQMGYASIIWYIVGALCFFLPTSFMFAEYGSALGNHHGGIYTWIKSGLGERWAFIGTFVWLVAWVITLIFLVPTILIALSAFISGKDDTQTWSVWGLSSTKTIGIISIIFVIVATSLAISGLKSIAWLSSLGGILITLLCLVFCSLSIALLFLRHGQLAQPIHHLTSFIQSPNPKFQSPTAILSFGVYAIFAYAGVESVAGISNHLKHPKKIFPRAIMIATVIMILLYTVSIFLCGVSVNWQSIMNHKSVTLGNAMYVVMATLGMNFGHAINLSNSNCLLLSYILVHFTGLATLLGSTGGFLVLLYSPLKSFLYGSNSKLWSKWILHQNKQQMPYHAMWLQSAIICIILYLVSFGGSGAKAFYQILTDMGNVSTTAQYILIVLAFPFFKQIKNLKRPFIIFHSKWITWLISIIVLIVIIFGIGFNFVEPLLTGNYLDDFWSFLGPIVFGSIAWLYYDLSTKSN